MLVQLLTLQQMGNTLVLFTMANVLSFYGVAKMGKECGKCPLIRFQVRSTLICQIQFTIMIAC